MWLLGSLPFHTHTHTQTSQFVTGNLAPVHMKVTYVHMYTSLELTWHRHFG